MKDETLVITEEKGGKVCRLAARGRIDSNSADILLYKLEDVLKGGQTVIILDMSRIEYLSSIGIRAILKIYKHASEVGGSFSIERPSEIVKNVLGMAALKDMLVTE